MRRAPDFAHLSRLPGRKFRRRAGSSAPSEDNVQVFAVWEPMLPTEWARPNTRVLARLSDPRIIQVWDKNHLIAGLIEKGANDRSPQCCKRNGIWWDVIAAYPPAATWTGSAPAPDLLNGTVIHTAPELEAKLGQRSLQPKEVKLSVATQSQACCSSPAAWYYWCSASLLAWYLLRMVGFFWYPLHAASAATVCLAVGVGCAANWFRNRTLHCGITSPVRWIVCAE